MNVVVVFPHNFRVNKRRRETGCYWFTWQTVGEREPSLLKMWRHEVDLIYPCLFNSRLINFVLKKELFAAFFSPYLLLTFCPPPSIQQPELLLLRYLTVLNV